MMHPIARILTVGCALGTLSSVALTQTTKYNIGIGVGAGLYFPSDSRVRNDLSSSLLSVGFHLGSTEGISNGKFGADFGLVSGHQNGNSFDLFQLLYGYEQTLGGNGGQGSKDGMDLVPYFKIGAGLAYADYSMTDSQGHFSGKRILPTAKFEVGTIFAKKLRLSAAYDTFASTDGFNFGGVELKLTYDVFSF